MYQQQTKSSSASSNKFLAPSRLPRKGLSSSPVPPPSKPPRTFAHDVYLNAKNSLRPTGTVTPIVTRRVRSPLPPITSIKEKAINSPYHYSNHIYSSIDDDKTYFRNATLRRRSKSFEHIYAEPESPIKDDIEVSEKFRKLRNKVTPADVDPYMVTDLFNAKETPSKSSRIKDIIKQSFSALRRFTRLAQFDRPEFEDDTASEISPSEIAERIIYVKTLKRNHTLETSDYYSSVADTKTEVSLCRCCLIIKDDGSTTIIPRNVKLNNTKLIEELTDFPGLDFDYYWFTIWTKDDKFLYAYCERQNRYKRRVCIVSDVYFPELYIRIFKALGSKENIDPPVISFLKKKCCALPGDDLNYLFLLNVQVPYDCQISLTKQSDLLYLISPSLLMMCIATLIHERRVVLVSRQEQRLISSCRQLVSLLYPLSWDYMFWPLVPSNHLSLCSAINMPFLIGIQSRNVWKFINAIKKRDDKLLIIDLDRNLVLMEIGDESKIIPAKISKAVKLALDLCLSMNDPQDKYRDGVTREAFIEMFIELIGTARLFVTEDSFSREAYIASIKSRSHQSFLQWFTETRLFNNHIKFNQLRLIQSRIHPKYNHFLQMGLFEMKSLQIINETQSKTTKSLFGKFKI
ncbi:DENN domain-containing protein 2A [Tetranychus urticae]|uniref:UDENN domain-containing protein n=1 Tax=Tetranychus urticae TaxID=32264 RepID=T1KAE0_TETUR|nr:DENN domain-containing protein 2A [Tetranychus urticae]